MALLTWYVARLRPGRASVAIVGLKDQGFDPYYPRYMVQVARDGRITERSEPVFPLYAFVNAPAEPAAWYAVNNTRGVDRLLGGSDDGVPSKLAAREIEALKVREQN